MKTVIPWTTLEIKCLKAVTIEADPNRLTPRQIIQLPEFQNRTISSIQYAIFAHKLADPTKSRRACKSTHLTQDKIDELKSFLENEGKYWPAPRVGENFSVSETTVLRYRRLFNVPKFTHKESLIDPIYRQWWKDNRKNRRQSYKIGTKKRRQTIHEELDDKKWAVDSSGLKKRRCKCCGTVFWKTEDFFHKFKTYLSSICLACPRKWSPKSSLPKYYCDVS